MSNIQSITTYKRTKIIATVGPKTNSLELIESIIRAGANGLRLNFSHGTHEEKQQQIHWIRQVSSQLHKPVAIIQDLQGPKIRLGDFDGIIEVKPGQQLSFEYKADYERSGHIPTQYDLSKKVRRGDHIYLFDGRVKAVATMVKNGVVYARAESSGMLVRRKGINLPDTDFGGDIITSKDKKDILFGVSAGVDYVAMSFVQSPQDIKNLRRHLKNLGSKAKIIAKIETAAALQHLEDVVIEADVVMVARGDLAVETLHESVPILQRKITGLGEKYNTPVIVATHMMLSMTDAIEPTRAEVSDIATAVITGVDCVMLSDETASGKYPVESVTTMKRIIRYTEANLPLKVSFIDSSKKAFPSSVQVAISEAIIALSDKVKAAAIIAETKSGATALHLAANRPEMPILAIATDSHVANQLAIVYGVKSFLRKQEAHAVTKLSNWLLQQKVLKKNDVIVAASGKYPGVVGSTDTIKVRAL
jgi:pyruvate kinase